MVAAPKLVVIVGETGSGKTALAIELARKFNGEVIAADSRTVYKSLDIGTAKPTTAEQRKVRHHLIDVAEPNQVFTAADFKRLANLAITDITARGKLPIMAGGSGLYVDSVLYDYRFKPPVAPAERARLQMLTVEQLQAEIRNRGWPLPFNARNPRHLIRLLETGPAAAAKNDRLRANSLVLGLKTDRAALTERLKLRATAMFAAGLTEETAALLAKYGPQLPALATPGYGAARQYLAGRLSLAEAQALFVHDDLRLAKRQRTWFGRNKSIHWLPEQGRLAQSEALITTFLNT